MTVLKMATLINDQGCHFDRLESTSMQKIREWAKDRSGFYTLDVNSVKFKVKNNRFYKIN